MRAGSQKSARNVEPDQVAVFLNIPYDNGFQSLYLAYIVGLVHLGLQPRAALEISGGARRLDKIIELIQTCRYSVHDLSRVQLDKKSPHVPRFNMPFELGLAVAWESTQTKDLHTWFVFEAVQYRLQKSLSDLNGTDPYFHQRKASNVFRELCNAFIRQNTQPTPEQMMQTYNKISRSLPDIMKKADTASPFEAKAFQALIYATRASMERISPIVRSNASSEFRQKSTYNDH